VYLPHQKLGEEWDIRQCDESQPWMVLRVEMRVKTVSIRWMILRERIIYEFPLPLPPLKVKRV
jgi:hypothetical protein